MSRKRSLVKFPFALAKKPARQEAIVLAGERPVPRGLDAAVVGVRRDGRHGVAIGRAPGNDIAAEPDVVDLRVAGGLDDTRAAAAGDDPRGLRTRERDDLGERNGAAGDERHAAVASAGGKHRGRRGRGADGDEHRLFDREGGDVGPGDLEVAAGRLEGQGAAGKRGGDAGNPIAVFSGGARRHAEWPADVYLEGPDQYRGWFHSSLLVATGVRDASPYRGVVTHGWTLDEQGRPMSNRFGNALYPIEICEKWAPTCSASGWFRRVSSRREMSERVMTQLSEAYRKIRNTFRFALGNLSDYHPSRDALSNDHLEEIDRWMLDRTAELVNKCREWYAVYEFHRVYHAIHDYCVVDLSAFYFDVLKDRLYTKNAQKQIPPLRTNRRLENHQRLGSPHRADSRFHFRRNLEVFAKVQGEPTASTCPCSRNRKPCVWPRQGRV